MCRGRFPNQRVQRWIFTHLTKRNIFATPFRQQQVNFNFIFPCGSKMNWYQDDTISIFGWTYWRPKNSVMETLSKKIICIIQNLKNPTHLTKRFGFSSIHLPSVKKSRDFAPGLCSSDCEVFQRFWLTSQYLRERERCIENKEMGDLTKFTQPKNGGDDSVMTFLFKRNSWLWILWLLVVNGSSHLKWYGLNRNRHPMVAVGKHLGQIVK